MKKLEKKLLELGLNGNESKIYLALLELGEAGIQRISEKSKISRTTTYSVIESLREKNLIVATKKNKRTYFYAENPIKLGKILSEKMNSFEKILPELISLSNLIDRKPKIKFFEGEEGLKNIYKDTLNHPDSELLAWTSPEAFNHIDNNFLLKEYIPQRVEKKIWAKVIVPKTKKMIEYKEKDSKSLRITRYLNNKTENILEVEIMLYGKNKISFQSFKESFGLIVESQAIYNTLKIIFNSQWENLE